MSLINFINTYFRSWGIASMTNCGAKCGYMKLCNKDTFIKVYYNLNGCTDWTDSKVTVDHVEACE